MRQLVEKVKARKAMYFVCIEQLNLYAVNNSSETVQDGLELGGITVKTFQKCFAIGFANKWQTNQLIPLV